MRRRQIPGALSISTGAVPSPGSWARQNGAHLRCRFPGIDIPRPWRPRTTIDDFFKEFDDPIEAKVRPSPRGRRAPRCDAGERAPAGRDEIAARPIPLPSRRTRSFPPSCRSRARSPLPLMRTLADRTRGSLCPSSPVAASRWSCGHGPGATRWAGAGHSRASRRRPESTGHLLVPLLAFDRFGYRIGYGAGHYDRISRNCARASR